MDLNAPAERTPILFGIVIPTYRRADGKTPYYLHRTLASVFAQNYTNFKVYLIGDHYDDEAEFHDIFTHYPAEKMHVENLPFAAERDKYTGHVLWTCGGTSATNHGMNMARMEGLSYICLLDHDDYWNPDHLEIIHDVIQEKNVDWICTVSTHIGDSYLPVLHSKALYLPAYPAQGELIKSSACWNTKAIPLRLRNVFEETGQAYAGDADLWDRMAEYMKKHSINGIVVNRVTCVHDTERSVYV